MRFLITALTCLALTASTPTRAAEPRPAKAPAATKKGAPKVIELEALVIEGKVAKPQVFYVLGRSRVQYENLKKQRVFVDRIVEGANQNPF